MVILSRIYTRTGDDGSTQLADLSRVPKTDPRIEAVGAVAEAGAQLGVARAFGPSAALGPAIVALQQRLFDLGADLSTPLPPPGEASRVHRLTSADAAHLETLCDAAGQGLAPLRSFLIPGGDPVSAHLHLAATVIRRAERAAWSAASAHGVNTPGGVNSHALVYLNRASDLVFLWARRATPPGQEELWTPQPGRRP